MVIADEEGHVLGAATLQADAVPGTGGDTGASGFVGIARPGAEVYRAYVVFDGDSEPVPIDEIRADEITRTD